jgi:hypothetical protein
VAKYSDAEGKEILRNVDFWPMRTQHWGVACATEYWIRCRPNDKNDERAYPTLSLPGANLFKTQPDGMWVYFRALRCADVLAIEVCGSMQNLNDKRSRYLSTGTGLVLIVPTDWFTRPVAVQHGTRLPRVEAAGCFKNVSFPANDAVSLPVRFLRALFVIPDQDYGPWMKNHVPAGHEFFMKHSSLKTGTSQSTQRFLAGMSFQAHFCTRR